MDVDLVGDCPRRLAADHGFRPPGWDAAECRHFRLVAQCAQAAKGVGDLHAMRVLRIQSREGGILAGTSSVVLIARRCLILTFKDGGTRVALSVESLDVWSKEMEESR